MARIGYLLITIGFVFAALYASITPKAEDQVQWSLYIPGLIASVVGVGLIQLNRRQAATDSGRVAANLDTLRASISAITENMAALDAAKEAMAVDAFHGHIDKKFRDDLSAFAEARKSLIHAHGIQTYAAVMNEFAAGERYLNRVWSASVDGYVDEVQAYIVKARAQFDGTKKILDRLVRG
jgi:hypothetical protein